MRHSSQNQTYTTDGAQRGFSLIELMISITIGLFILASLSTMFVNQSKSRAELDKSNRMIDNGRYAMDVLSSNLRLAGFYDDFIPTGTPVNLYDPCDLTPITDPTKNLELLIVYVQGYHAPLPAGQATAPYIAQLPCSLTYSTGSNLALQPGSDILVVRRASTALTPAAGAQSGTTYLQISKCSQDAAVPPNNYQIVTAPSGSFATMRKKDCTAVSDLRQYIELTFFISPFDKPGDGIPTLKQIDQNGNIMPIAEGIEYMQIDYGIDGSTGDGLMEDINGDGNVDAEDQDGVPDSYSKTCTGCTTSAQWAKYWSSVVAARITIVARNTEPSVEWTDKKTYSLGLAGTVGPFNDHYKRHVFTQLVRLVNPAGRKETP